MGWGDIMSSRHSDTHVDKLAGQCFYAVLQVRYISILCLFLFNLLEEDIKMQLSKFTNFRSNPPAITAIRRLSDAFFQNSVLTAIFLRFFCLLHFRRLRIDGRASLPKQFSDI